MPDGDINFLLVGGHLALTFSTSLFKFVCLLRGRSPKPFIHLLLIQPLSNFRTYCCPTSQKLPYVTSSTVKSRVLSFLHLSSAPTGGMERLKPTVICRERMTALWFQVCMFTLTYITQGYSFFFVYFYFVQVLITTTCWLIFISKNY